MPQLADQRLSINAAWLLKLRWVAVIGQLTTIIVVGLALRIDIALTPLLVAVGVTALSNLLFGAWVSHARQTASATSSAVWYSVIGGVMLLDLIVLTSLLFFTGGPTNPFSIFYFVNLALSGILLPPRGAWLLNGFAVLCWVILCYRHEPVEVLQYAERLQSIRDRGRVLLADTGLLVAFVTCSSVIVYFTTRLTTELETRERDLRRAELLRARSEKLEALGTLAAGAAHELATPLSTIAVVAKEVERELEGKEVAGVVTGDVALIRSEVDRCRSILDRMSVRSGLASGESLVVMTAEQLVESILADWGTSCPVRVRFASDAREQRVSAPAMGLAQVLHGVVQNAIDANEGSDGIDLRIDLDAGRLRIQVQDRGAGMSREVLKRAGEPFFTTKEPGKGMGLGLFLARSVVERLGGSLDIRSATGEGTTVIVRLPLYPSD